MMMMINLVVEERAIFIYGMEWMGIGITKLIMEIDGVSQLLKRQPVSIN